MPFWTARRALGGIVVAVILMALGWAAVVVAVAVQAAHDQATGADAIAVLGAAQYNGRPSPVFRARLDHAATLYQRGLAPTVLVTGGVGARDTLNEANVGRSYLVHLGIPDDAVIPLAGGHDTFSSIDQVRRWFNGRDSRRVLLVSDGFHMLRLQIIARRLGLTPYTSPAAGSPIHANVRRNTGYLFAEGFKVPFTWLFQR
ncbi:MAG TPA: YdcF family protein [Gemmatimonadales bacterium]|nr:YdcF family protein [Gemmatimonadales bacterium]